MGGKRETAIREAELKVIEAASNHVCHVAPWFRLDRCAICKAVDALEKAKNQIEIKCGICQRVMLVPKEDVGAKLTCAGCVLGDESDNG
jgi:hypothetical protein